MLHLGSKPLLSAPPSFSYFTEIRLQFVLVLFMAGEYGGFDWLEKPIVTKRTLQELIIHTKSGLNKRVAPHVLFPYVWEASCCV
jgi:hypothetical protein